MASDALRGSRDTLRQPFSSTESLTSALSIVLSSLDLHPTSIPPTSVPTETLRAIQRYLPSIQISLLTSTLPTFLHALNEREIELVDRFFCPPKFASLGALRLGREIAGISYSSLPTLLSTKQVGGEIGSQGIPIPSRDYLLRILGGLVGGYGINDLYWSVWGSGNEAESSKDGGLRVLRWEESVKALTSLPAKVANAIGRWKGEGWKGDCPPNLIPKSYFRRMIIRLEELMYELKTSPESIERIQLVWQRLASIGLLSPSSNIDLMGSIVPLLLQHLHPPTPLEGYPPTYLSNIFLGLQTSILNPFVSSLLAHLCQHIHPQGPDKPDERCKRAAEILSSIIGPAKVGGEAWDAVLRLALNPTTRNDAQARLIVAWVSRTSSSIQPFIESVISAWTSTKHIKYSLYTPQFQLTHILLLSVSLLPPYHPFLSIISTRPAFINACQAYLSHPDGSVRRLGLLVAEIMSELTIKEEGGLEYDEKAETEELMAGLEIDEETMKPKGFNKQAVKSARRLRFGGGMWDGEGDGREEARWLRPMVGVKDGMAVLDVNGDWMLGWTSGIEEDRDVHMASPRLSVTREKVRGRTESKRPVKISSTKPKPKIIMLDSDQSSDPLLSYSPPQSPSASSTRSPSPTPSFLEEIAADPSLALDATQKKKVTRPVYILQLLQLLREKDNPDAIEMAMKHGEGLIRAKRGFGLELVENSVPLAAQLLGMSNQYALDKWEEGRQGMITALVACTPRQVAPYLAEQYFVNQYSLQQKSVMLTAITMGARELAGLTVPEITTRRVDFPSRTLPPSLHRKYITSTDNHPSEQEVTGNQIEAAVDGMRGMMLEKGARRASEALPDIARAKRLRVTPTSTTRVGKGMAVAEVGTLRDRQLLERRQKETDLQVQRKTQTPIIAYSGIAAEYFIMPLINRFWIHFQDDHIRENRALAFGARFRGAGAGMILSPLALEKLLMSLALLIHAARNAPAFLAVLAPEVVELGLTVGIRHPHRPEMEVEADDGSKAESQIVGAALELVLVALDLSGEVDGGRTICMDKPELVSAAGEWARGIFEVESEGGKVVGGQGGREGRIKGAAAGVVVRVGEMHERWGSGRR